MSKTFKELLREAKQGISETSVEEVHRLLQKGDRIVLLDVREKEEIAQGYIEGAVFLSRGLLEMKAETLLPEKDVPVVVYCAAGVRSLFAAKTLKEMGYAQVLSMAGGFDGWKAAGYEVATDAALTHDQINWYRSHILLKKIREKSQIQLLKAKVFLRRIRNIFFTLGNIR